MGMLILGLGLEPSPAFMFLEQKKGAILLKGRASPYSPALHPVRSHNWLLSTETHRTPGLIFKLPVSMGCQNFLLPFRPARTPELELPPSTGEGETKQQRLEAK